MTTPGTVPAAPVPEGVTPALDVRNIVKRFGGVTALNHVSMTVLPGEVTALVGDNGAGKSTLVRCLSGVHQPDEGEILVDGKLQTFHDPSASRHAGIETVFQELALSDNLDVASNMFLGRELTHGPTRLFRLRHKEMETEAQTVLARYGIRMPSVRSTVRELSGGQRQGVAIARAVGWGSRIVLMDEPTAALGVRETGRILDIVRGLAERGLAVLLISHNMEQVHSVSDAVWILRGGNMVAGMRTADTTTSEIVHYITTGQGLT
ncbi:sugar ABC transporter ATP-binding protein [Streptomyces ferrugineus]|uniref:Sugar ABC transporter ATP-binding protein n=1 Tax=Streptomyces ferrugineus TaxID=1413221 RepID=A0A7M2SCE4_9ACTN|nr:ATP-binding cassette domain-containing protein [Streptomyces ferrugineus]QOV33158.1 sugar ABC transporter ATP-binding protein [Streptomyces ferrugineus]